MAGSKSLGTLTLDLVARTGNFVSGMDKASRKSQNTAKQIERYSNQIGKALTAASAAAVTGMVALVTSTATGAREIQNLARLAGTTPQEFQKATYASKRFGIEQDKLSGILKDTNERIGDFIQTGGGPMADFFENIAPKVGVTADQFARLSGKDALQLYVKSLEDAGVSQKDMTFYMEAVASDATALLPLLRDNGKEMKALGDEAERTGNVFSDLEFDQLDDVRRGLDELTGAATGMKNEVVMAAIPAINDLIDLLSDESTMKSAQALGTAVVTAMNKAAMAVDGAIKITQFLAEELASITAGAAADDIVRLEDELKTLYSMLDNPSNRVRFFGKDGAVVYYNKDEIWDMIAETENKIVNFRNSIKNGVRPTPLLELVEPPEAPKNPNKSCNSEDLESDMAQRRETLIRAFETEKQAILRVFGERDEEISALEDERTLSAMAAADLRYQNEAEKIRAIGALQVEQDEVRARLQQQMNSQVLGMAAQSAGALTSLIEQSQGDQSAAYKAAFLVQKGLQFSQAVMSTELAAASALAPPPIGLGPVAGLPYAGVIRSAGYASAGIIAATTIGELAGQAHEGIDSVRETGSYYIKSGERITTAETSAKLDATLDRVAKSQNNGGNMFVNIHDAPPGTRTQERTDSEGNKIVDIFVADMANGGPMWRSLAQTGGLKRQGR